MRRNTRHPGVLDAEFLLEQSGLVVSAVDLSLKPNLTIPTLGRLGEQSREGVVAESQDVEDGGANSPRPTAGQGQCGVHGGPPQEPLEDFFIR
jgi:hypothetical protein